MSKVICCLAVSILAAGIVSSVRGDAQPLLSKAVTPDKAMDRIITREHEEIETISSYPPIIETYVQRGNMSLNQIIDRIVSREHDEIVAFRRFRPIIETYIQNSTVRSGEVRLTGDFYLLGQANFMGDDLIVTPLVQRKGQRVMRGQFMGEYDPRGFLQEAYVDRDVFDRDYYDFHFVGHEVLGNVRCLVFDISPRRSRAGTAHFRGRIWVEDQDFTIVRFNGKFHPGGRHIWYDTAYAHFDSWRVNVQPGLWLPAYIFNEEMPYKGSSRRSVGFEAETRLWGYNLHSSRDQGDPSSSLSVEFRTPVKGGSASPQHSYSPPQAQPNWRGEAETTSLDALERTGRLATPGNVDEALNSVLNSLEVANHIEIGTGIRCRVLTTTSLEIFTIGHTIAVSRGLIDVLPDETTLAILLAQELASVMESNGVSDRAGFGNLAPVPAMNVPAMKVLNHLQFRVPAGDQSAYGQRALGIVRNSPYAGNLGSARAFFEQLHKQSQQLPQLIRPSLANEVYRISQLLESATEPQSDRLDKTSALPMRDRVELDPWSDKAESLKTQPARLEGTRERLPFEVAPFMPFLTRYGETAGLSEATSAPVGVAR